MFIRVGLLLSSFAAVEAGENDKRVKSYVSALPVQSTP